MTFHPFNGGRRCNADRNLELLGLGEPLPNPRADLFETKQIVTPSPSEVSEVGIEWVTNSSFEFGPRVEVSVGADELLPVWQGQLVTMVIP